MKKKGKNRPSQYHTYKQIELYSYPTKPGDLAHGTVDDIGLVQAVLDFTGLGLGDRFGGVENDAAKAAEAAGAEYVGGEEYMQKIMNENWMDFDVVIATPDMMGIVGRLPGGHGPLRSRQTWPCRSWCKARWLR